MNKRETIELKYVFIIDIIAVCVICFWGIRVISDLNYIAVLNDEFGYWGNAAVTCGYKWNELLELTPYYSMGYSFLLIPIILIFKTSTQWYKMAIALNVIMLCISFFLCCRIGERLFREKSRPLIHLMSLVVILYPSNMIYAHVAWSETFLYFLFWIQTYLIIKLDENYSNIRLFALLVVSFFGYLSHGRNIINLIITLIMILTLLIIRCKDNCRRILFFCVLVIGLFICVKFVNRWQINNLYANSGAASLNQISTNSATIQKYLLMLVGNIYSYCKSLMYKFVVFTWGTMLTGLFAIVYVYETAKKYIQNRSGELILSKIWMAAVPIMTIAATALQIGVTERKDAAVYTRYFEHTIGPLMLIGLAVCIMYARKYKWILTTYVLLEVLVIYKSAHLIFHNQGAFNSICSPIVGAIYDYSQSQNEFIGIMLAMAIIPWLIYFAAGYIEEGYILKSLVKGGIWIGFLVVFSWLMIQGETFMKITRECFDTEYVPLAEYMKKNSKTIYYYLNSDEDTTYCVYPKYIQFMSPDTEIKVIYEKDLESLTGNNYYIIGTKFVNKELEFLDARDDYICVFDEGRMRLYQKNE